MKVKTMFKKYLPQVLVTIVGVFAAQKVIPAVDKAAAAIKNQGAK